jgi:ribonuclease R
MSRGQGKLYTGRIKRNPDGFGFFVSETDEIEDIYIPKEEMKGVFTNDLVLITVNKRGGRFGTRGKIKKILERSAQRYVGRLNFNQNNSTFYLKDSSHSWGQSLNIYNPERHPEGDLVLVEITSYPELGSIGGFEGKIVSSLGSSVDPNIDNIRILHEAKVPTEFSKMALKEAEALGDEVKEADKKGRRDLRNLSLITIDGVTAKDFDDAIYVEKKKNGDFKLIVAIADVSHYVKKDSHLDQEAYDKGTSVYLSNFVCPMLPEAISNGLCSLNPNVDRLAFCCEMHLSNTGEVKNYEFFEAVIKSHARVTYGQAQEFIEDGISDFTKSVEENIKCAEELAGVLNEKRMSEGSIDFDLPAVKVLVDDSGEATDLVKEDRIFAHRLIEELMLVTNICASKFLDKHDQGQLYRVHEPPDQEDLDKLQNLLKKLLGGGISRIRSGFDFQRLNQKLSELERPALKDIVQGLTLRSLRQAQYSSANKGHFGLGFTHYAHFTSPIRRYPDLVIHRQIKSVLNKDSSYTDEDLSTMGTVLSAAEQRAVKAERKVISIKKARFFERYVGEEFEGYISSMAKFGLFVTLIEFPLDGLVKVEDLSGDHFIYDEESLTLKGKRTKKVFTVGDRVRIRVAQVSLDEGKIDFALLSHKGQKGVDERHSEKPKKNKGKKIARDNPKQEGSKNSSQKSSQKKIKGKTSAKSKKSSGASSMFSSSSNARGLSFSKPGKSKRKKRR